MRDYSLVGRETKSAEDRGLVNAEWYSCPISRQKLKELSKRRDGPAIRDTVIWFGILIAAGALGYRMWGTWWAVPCFAVYGVCYGSLSGSRWHECGHRTAFKTVWLNDAIYEIASFMVFRESVAWRWSHARHHSDTMIVGRDPEVGVPRPPDLWSVALAFFALKSVPLEFAKMVKHACGRISPAEATFIPDGERPRLYRNARIYLCVLALVAFAAIASHSILPLMYIGLPAFYGVWLLTLIGLTEHAGLAEDVLDHRLNSRTLYLNPVLRFCQWEMNYHVEHHMFPMVPYHALGKLHQEIKADMPRACAGLLDAYREIIPTLIRQVKDPDYHAERELPAPISPASTLEPK
jgi:fatty acid desaturase